MKNYIMYIVLFIYVIINTLLNKLYPNVSSNIINPLFLILMSIYIHFNYGDAHGRFPKNKEYIKKVLIIMLIYLIVYLLLGLVFGFVNSPYSREFISLIKNIWRIIIPVIFIEYIRSFLLNSNSKSKISIILITLIFFILELNVNTFLSNLFISEEGFKYFSSSVIPLIATEILCSYLCLKGSYKLSLPYRLILQLVVILSPVYPDLNWFITGIIGIVFPAIIYVVCRYDYEKKKRDATRRTLKKQNPATYIPVFVVITIFASFMLGLFKYEPIAIVSNSMNPVFYRGDVVILHKVNKEELKKIEKYNIIVYSIGNQQIVHRVIDIIEENDEIYFKTQGDANISPDLKLVSGEQVVGVYQFSIKYIGYPSVWLNDIFKSQKPKVEIK